MKTAEKKTNDEFDYIWKHIRTYICINTYYFLILRAIEK